jgi:hypothetical protein
MKIIIIVALSITAIASQQQLRKEKQTLVDFRVDRSSTPPKISAATQRSVLTKVFRRYLTDESRCDQQFEPSGNIDPLKAARNAGQIVPSIYDVATGSFTAAGQLQTAYVISVSECNATHADNFGTKRVAIFSGQQLIADVDADFRSSIVLKTDLDSDGINELLMTTGDMNQGTVIQIAALVSFKNGRSRVIEDFGTVIEDSCSAGSPGSSSKASLISIADVTPGQMPKFKIDNYVSNCRVTKRWRFLSSGKMQE